MNGAMLAVRNPATGRTDHHIRPLGAPAVAALAGRLRMAQPAWSALGLAARCRALDALAAAIDAGRAPLLAALAADTGRFAISALEIDSVVAMIRRWTTRAPAILAAAERDGAGQSAMPGIRFSTSFVPYPLVGVISPWNFPLLLALTDAIPALAAGSAVLVKPSEVTPRFIGPLLQLVAGVPLLSDVLAVVEGDGATGAALVDAVDFIAFTGSVATGRKVGEAAARAFIPASLELGGKDPMIVLASADPAWAAGVALSASCRANGQACQSIERIYVADAIAEAFTDALVTAASAVAGADIGPFIFQKQVHIVEAQLADAVARGATIRTGGTIETIDGGLYLRPTVVTGVTHAMTVMTEETFGPVLPVMPFATTDAAVALANDSGFGLSAAVLAGTTQEARAVALRLEAGAISINDGALTSLLSDAEKSSFGLSGLGPSRMGASGLLRFFRRRALLERESGSALLLAAFAEHRQQ